MNLINYNSVRKVMMPNNRAVKPADVAYAIRRAAGR